MSTTFFTNRGRVYISKLKHGDVDSEEFDNTFKDGSGASSWAASQASFNMDGAFVGTPGVPHILARVGATVGEAVPVQVTAITATPLRFSEARNGPDRDGNVNWLEIENVSDEPVNLRNYEISLSVRVYPASIFCF